SRRLLKPAAPTPVSTLSLHDALPISYRNERALRRTDAHRKNAHAGVRRGLRALQGVPAQFLAIGENNQRPISHRALTKCLDGKRSEEHTSELQSRENLVCRLLLEKKK